LPILEPEGRCGIERDMWKLPIDMKIYFIYDNIAQV